jgi:leader peptidase (prepilin peptidase)/N-methyltransferase
MMRILGTIFAGLLGLAFGSFLNVCLSRWPEGESVVQPRSHCRNCSHTLSWWENIPLFSWIALRGRCRECRTWIGWRYPMVELAVGILWAAFVWHAEPLFPGLEMSTSELSFTLGSGLAQIFFFWILIALAVLDAENLWLPDWITVPGITIGFVLNLLRFKVYSSRTLAFYGALGIQGRFLYHMAFKWLLGILAAAAIILLIRWIYWLIRRREGLGLGDAKLMALLAAWLGLPQAMLAFVLGVILGSVVAVGLLVLPGSKERSESWGLSKLPLGTFLCIGGILSSLWGQPILAAYLRWAGF